MFFLIMLIIKEIIITKCYSNDMNMRKYINILLCTFIIAFVGCDNKDEIDYSNMGIPEIDFILDEMFVDLNKADNLPIVAVVFSEVGIKEVKMYVVDTEGNETFYKEISTFYDNKKYSIKEKVVYDSSVAAFKIVAVDLGGRESVKLLDITTIPYQDAPTVDFELDEIVVDEAQGGIIPTTRFTASCASSTFLSKIEVVLFSVGGEKTQILVEDFDGIDETTYQFEHDIVYIEGNRSLQVIATDRYNKKTIAALPITYIAIPPPSITDQSDSQYTLDLNSTKKLSFTATSEAGISQIVVYKDYRGLLSELIDKSYASQEIVDFNEEITFDDEKMNSLKVEVRDINNKKTTFDIPCLIGFNYIQNYIMGGQYYIKGFEDDPDNIRHIFSFNRMTGITLEEAYANIADADIYFFMYNQSGSCLRINSFGQTSNQSQMTGVEYQDLLNNIPSVWDWGNRNDTRLLLLNEEVHGFSFDNVTLYDLNHFSYPITLDRPSSPLPGVGQVYLVKTAATSSAGQKIGLVKIENLVTPTKYSFENRYNYPASALGYRKATTIKISVKFPK